MVGCVGDLVKEMATCSFPLHIGGPVAQNELFFIHSRFDLLLSGDEIRENIYFGGDPELLFSLVNQGKIKEDEVKFFLGYSGWQPAQLEAEINVNSWAVQNKFPTALVLKRIRNFFGNKLLSDWELSMLMWLISHNHQA
ncbi:YqgE/AlgH family protein [Sphingobacterium sp. KU25419]|nr:YqgE/AlgH family protein [Sphingobacterium sp. KU25419]